MALGKIEAMLPLLRAPPFPGAGTAVSRARPIPAPPLDAATIDRLFAAIRDAQVGGRFWDPLAYAGQRAILVRARSVADVGPLLARLSSAERADALWLLPASTADRAAAEALVGSGSVLVADVDPWSLLSGDARLIAHGDDEWAALAHIAGLPVEILSAGRFGGIGADAAQIRGRVADELSRYCYLDPFSDGEVGIEVAVSRLAEWRCIFTANRGIVAACGIAWWKRHEIARFLWSPTHRLRFFRSERRAIDHAAWSGGAVAVWPSRVSTGMAQAARARGVPLIRIEDGFVRSVGLGADLVPPSSITVDRLGIHYDPGTPSELEEILAQADFPPPLIERAQRLRQAILKAGIGKYGRASGDLVPQLTPRRRLVLVPGQVEDDMSVRLGGAGLSSNLELLRRARAIEPDAEIWFRPHPDVDAGHRHGAIQDADALRYADRVERGGGMAPLLDQVDAVHVLTSLTGFEALLRGREVTCHGLPFYAGWGLTRDVAPVPDRRGRRLTLDELVAAVLILYPRYLDPVTGLPCPPEVLIDRIAAGTAHNRLSWIEPIRRWQGRLTRRWT